MPPRASLHRKVIGTAPFDRDLTQGSVGLADQPIGMVVIARIDADNDAGRDLNTVAIDVEGLDDAL